MWLFTKGFISWAFSERIFLTVTFSLPTTDSTGKQQQEHTAPCGSRRGRMATPFLSDPGGPWSRVKTWPSPSGLKPLPWKCDSKSPLRPPGRNLSSRPRCPGAMLVTGVPRPQAEKRPTRRELGPAAERHLGKSRPWGTRKRLHAEMVGTFIPNPSYTCLRNLVAQPGPTPYSTLRPGWQFSSRVAAAPEPHAMSSHEEPGERQQAPGLHS